MKQPPAGRIRKRQPINAEVRTRRLVIVDDEGRDRIQLGTEAGDAFALVLDRKGKPRVGLEVNPDGTAKVTFPRPDDPETPIMGMGVDPRGLPALVFGDARGVNTVTLGLNEKKGPFLHMRRGGAGADVTFSPDGRQGRLQLIGNKGHTKLMLEASELGSSITYRVSDGRSVSVIFMEHANQLIVTGVAGPNVGHLEKSEHLFRLLIFNDGRKVLTDGTDRELWRSHET